MWRGVCLKAVNLTFAIWLDHILQAKPVCTPLKPLCSFFEIFQHAHASPGRWTMKFQHHFGTGSDSGAREKRIRTITISVRNYPGRLQGIQDRHHIWRSQALIFCASLRSGVHRCCFSLCLLNWMGKPSAQKRPDCEMKQNDTSILVSRLMLAQSVFWCLAPVHITHVESSFGLLQCSRMPVPLSRPKSRQNSRQNTPRVASFAKAHPLRSLHGSTFLILAQPTTEINRPQPSQLLNPKKLNKLLEIDVVQFCHYVSYLCVFVVVTSSQEMPRDNNMAKFIWAVPWPCSEAALSHFSAWSIIHEIVWVSYSFDVQTCTTFAVLLLSSVSIHILKWAKVATFEEKLKLYSISAYTSSMTEVERHLKNLLFFIPSGVLTFSCLVIVFKERQIVLSKMMALLSCRTIEVLCLLQILNLSRSQRNTLHGNRVN